MRAEFNNGTSVSRIWRDAEEAELLAIFQYETDALSFATARHAEGNDKAEYVVACSYGGKVKVIRPTKAEASPQEGSDG